MVKGSFSVRHQWKFFNLISDCVLVKSHLVCDNHARKLYVGEPLFILEILSTAKFNI